MIIKAEQIFKKLNLEGLLPKSFISDRMNYSRIYRYCLLPGQAARLWPVIDFRKLHGFSDNLPARVYVSVPFCINQCLFCGINEQMRRKKYPSVFSVYPKYLKKEIFLLSRYIEFKNLPVKYFHFGGGTPTALKDEQLVEIIECLKDAFCVMPEAHFSAESDPNSIIGPGGVKKLSLLRKLGFDRISIGMQEFNDRVLRMAGRGHTSSGNIEASCNVLEAGFKETNFDLIYGLPGQSLADWHSTINKAIELNPDSVYLYRLRFDTCTPMFRMFLKNPGIFPSLKDILLMHIVAKENFESEGYVEYAPGIFRKKEKDPQFMLFSPESKLLGIGVGAIGRHKDRMYFNYHNGLYFNELDKNILPIRNIFRFSLAQLMRKYVISGLSVLERGVAKSGFKTEFEADIESAFSEILSLLSRDGLISIDDEAVKLTYKGALFADDIFKILWPRGWLDKIAPAELVKSWHKLFNGKYEN